ncbi:MULTISPECIES: pectate lyase family protein [unclassified Brevundimonas]|uniref:pectate lyase family protein n=1 Tax=unclassified Brevundimonas TaxID=2622653 RepID=UPI000C690E0A|nr:MULTISPECIES: pectate lyase [unclassified Brevundimonas]MAL87869.1 pectate lyase [Brevundimonas sp.]HAJ01719.1 pectate lyase [Brevundimonas sp.]
MNRRHTLISTCLGLFAALTLSLASAAPTLAQSGPLAFPGALGWASATPGGRGGEIIRVTNLNSEGPGSLRAAIEAEGPRIVVFEVGGVIDLEMKTLRLRNPYITIAGQTAPSPGITLIRGGMDVGGHDVIIQHIRIRPGSADQGWMSGWDEDGIATVSAYNVIIDHCSLTWATDENLSASGPRFTGSTPDEWRRGTSHNITFSNNIVGESLAYSTHSKGEHSKGSLIHDNVTGLLIIGNLYAHNYERSPLFKGGVHGVIVNNLIYNPGPRAIHYNLAPEEWGTVPFEVGKMSVVGNVLRAGPSTPTDHLAFMMIGGAGDVEYYGLDNIAVDQVGEPIRMFGRYTTSPARIIEMPRPPVWWEGLTPIPAVDVQRSVLSTAGARPWDRDMRDVLLIAEVAEGRGEIIDHEREVGGYPAVGEPTRKAFNPDDWNLHDMTPKRDDVLDRPANRRGT